MDKNAQFLKELKETLNKIGMPQTSLAKHIGYASPTITRVINGQQKPSDELMSKLRSFKAELGKLTLANGA